MRCATDFSIILVNFDLSPIQDIEDVLSCSSYEGFVAREHYAMCLSPRPLASLGRHGGKN